MKILSADNYQCPQHNHTHTHKHTNSYSWWWSNKRADKSMINPQLKDMKTICYQPSHTRTHTHLESRPHVHVIAVILSPTLVQMAMTSALESYIAGV